MSVPDDREAAFIAAVTASATHEMRNVLAIVQESAGLIEDLVRSAERRGPPDPTRLLGCVERIAAQVARGAELLTSLNGFAHGLEHATALLPLEQEVRQAALLSERLLRQRGHAVEIQPGDPDLMVHASALRLQMALFAALECCMELLPGPGTVGLCARAEDGRPAVECAAQVRDATMDAAPTRAASWTRLAELVDGLGGSLHVAGPGGRFRLLLPGPVAA